MSHDEYQKDVDFERLRGALFRPEERKSAAEALERSGLKMSQKTLNRRLEGGRIKVKEYAALMTHLGANPDEYLLKSAGPDVLARTNLLGTWQTLHVEYNVDHETGEGSLKRLRGLIEVFPESDGIRIEASVEEARKETASKAWHEQNCLMFESTIEGWPRPSGLGITQMFLGTTGIMRGFTMFYDEVLDKPFWSPHVAYRQNMEDSYVLKQSLVWFNEQVKAVEQALKVF